MSAGRRHVGLLVGVVLAAALVGGCGSGGDESPPVPPAPSPVPTLVSRSTEPSEPIPTEVVSDGAVKYQYGLFWQAFINAQVHGDPDAPELLRRAGGQALTYAQELVAGYRDNGWVRVIKDGFNVNPVVVQRADTTARVTDSQDWTKWPLTVRRTGQVVDGSTPRQCITADLMRRGEIWAVTRLAFAPNTC